MLHEKQIVEPLIKGSKQPIRQPESQRTSAPWEPEHSRAQEQGQAEPREQHLGIPAWGQGTSSWETNPTELESVQRVQTNSEGAAPQNCAGQQGVAPAAPNPQLGPGISGAEGCISLD